MGGTMRRKMKRRMKNLLIRAPIGSETGVAL
jgi:hypothetical protein